MAGLSKRQNRIIESIIEQYRNDRLEGKELSDGQIEELLEAKKKAREHLYEDAKKVEAEIIAWSFILRHMDDDLEFSEDANFAFEEDIRSWGLGYDPYWNQ